jgi:hypothetical protein
LSVVKPGTPQEEHGGRLERAMRKARLAEAARLDAVLEVRDVEQLRLLALKDDLDPVVAERPEARAFFDLALSGGTPPRLWIDMVTHVAMEPDPRTYRFAQDTQNGRITRFESADRAEMAQQVIDYMAHRLIERERLQAAQERRPEISGQAPGLQALSLFFAWISGFALGVLALFVVGVLLARGP